MNFGFGDSLEFVCVLFPLLWENKLGNKYVYDN